MVCAACGCEQIDGISYCKACGSHLGAGSANASGGSFGQKPWLPLAAPQGAGTQAPPPPPYGAGPVYWAPMLQLRRDRVRQNLQPMGITWCLWGAYRLLIGAAAGFAVHAMAHHSMWFGDSVDFFPSFLSQFLPIIAVSAVVMAALAFLTGWGLLTAKPWGRTLAIIMAILTLIKIPLGTALGIYTLWVLAPRVSGMEYEALSQGTPTRL